MHKLVLQTAGKHHSKPPWEVQKCFTGVGILLKHLNFSGFLFSHEKFGFDGQLSFLLIHITLQALFHDLLQLMVLLNLGLGGLGMFDFPEKIAKVKAWNDDVVSGAVRRNTC